MCISMCLMPPTVSIIEERQSLLRLLIIFANKAYTSIAFSFFILFINQVNFAFECQRTETACIYLLFCNVHCCVRCQYSRSDRCQHRICIAVYMCHAHTYVCMYVTIVMSTITNASAPAPSSTPTPTPSSTSPIERQCRIV